MLPEEPPLPPPPPPVAEGVVDVADIGELKTTIAGGGLSCLRSMSIWAVWADGHTRGGGRCRAAPAVSLEVSMLPPLARARAGDREAPVSAAVVGGVWGDRDEAGDPACAAVRRSSSC